MRWSLFHFFIGAPIILVIFFSYAFFGNLLGRFVSNHRDLALREQAAMERRYKKRKQRKEKKQRRTKRRADEESSLGSKRKPQSINKSSNSGTRKSYFGSDPPILADLGSVSPKSKLNWNTDDFIITPMQEPLRKHEVDSFLGSEKFDTPKNSEGVVISQIKEADHF